MLNWREIPFVRLLLPLYVGILVATKFNYPIAFGNVLFMLCSGGIIVTSYITRLYPYRWVSGIFINVALFLFGHQLAYYQADTHHPIFFEQFLHEGTHDTFVGIVDAIPKFEQYTRITLRLQRIEADKEWQPVHGQFSLFIHSDSLTPFLAYGDQLIFRTQATPIAAPANPDAFDLKQFYEYKNLYYQGFIYNSSDWSVLARQKGNPLYQLAFNFRLKFINTLREHLKTPNEFAVGSALILGYKEVLTSEIRNAYTSTGAMHVLAVSGLHVGLIFLLFNYFLQFFSFRKAWWNWVKALLLLLVIWSFALLTGASASVCRAATMFSFVIIANASSRHSNIYNTLALSAFVMLCHNPFYIMDIGFQLSYLAVLSIVYFQPLIYPLIFIDNRIGDYFWKLTSVSLAAQIGTLPISLYYFHQFPSYFFLSGLIVIPAAMLILSIGLLLLFVSFISSTLAAFVGLVLYTIIGWVNSCIFIIQQLPFSLISGIWISFFAVLLLYSFIVLLVIAFESKRIKWVYAALSIFLLFGICRNIQNYQYYQQESAVIYAANKASLLDFIYQNERYSLQSTQLKSKQLQYTAQNHRWANGIQYEETQMLDSLEHSPLIHFKNKQLLLPNASLDINALQDKSIDYILLTQNVDIDIAELLNANPCSLVIFDNSNTKKQVEKWKFICEKQAVDYYDIRAKGAFVF